MKNVSRKVALLTLLILFSQPVLFSEEVNSDLDADSETEQETEKKSQFELGTEIAELKYDLFKIENKLDEYENISDFDLGLIEAKKEYLLRKKESELKEAVNQNKYMVENILEDAFKDIFEKGRELKNFGKDFWEYIKKYFEE